MMSMPVSLRASARFLAGLGGVAIVTAGLRFLGVTNATTVALAYLLVVLFVASLGDLAVASAISVAATLAFNYFFLPPAGSRRPPRRARTKRWIDGMS